MSARQRKPRRDSAKCAIVNRTVTFNVADPFQRQMLEYADTWVNFSGAVKRIIAESMRDDAPKTYLSIMALPNVSNDETPMDDPLESASGLW